ncbi:MAG: hypothetical protein QF662_05830 [Phycisphaerae bacterium]|nr:hypothetical protein [Phycisphaerae bacterium]
MGGKILALGIALLSIAATASAQETPSRAVISERLLAQVDPASWIPHTLKVSPDSRHVAYVAKNG